MPPSVPDDPAPARGTPGPPRTRPPLASVEAAFAQIIDLAPSHRDAALARLCDGDSALEAEVRSLLTAAAGAGAFLQQPALGRRMGDLRSELDKPEPPDPLINEPLGSYTVQRRIASGGMGTVYLAHRNDGQFEQHVAIKVVKRGMDSEEILRRFRTERQTLAALDHPNIARLIDGGMTPDGRPFVVMEHIDGVPIDSYCDANRLALRDRLKLFRQVCAGVQHAHQNLVIHRDLKPSNILVTPQGVPKLLDFGIAKVISGGTSPLGRLGVSATAETDRRLTPEYASPEQVQGGPLATTSDVYSLGIVLYELLTGTRPYYFNLRTSEEVRRVVCSLPPLPPSQAVTVKASRLRTDSSDQSGYHAGPRRDSDLSPPAAAAPNTGPAPDQPAVDVPKTRGVSTTRLRTLLRGDLDVVVLMALRKEPDRRYASAEQFSSDIDRYLRDLPVLARRDTLSYRAAKFVSRHRVSVPLAAAAVTLLATATVMLSRQSQQLESQRSALAATNQRLDENLRRLTESRRFLRTVIAGADASNEGPNSTLGATLQSAADALAAAPPTDPLTRAAAEEEIGRAMMSLGMLDAAEPLLRSAATLYDTLPADADARRDAAVTLAELAFYRGNHADAESAFRALLASERAIPAPAAASPERISTILNNLGASVRAGGRASEAITIQREALAATIAAFGAPSIEAAETRNNLASAIFQSGDIPGATTEFTEALRIRRTLLRPDHPLILRCESNLGLALLRDNRPADAVPLLEHAATTWDAAFGPEHPGRVPTMTTLAQALRALNRPQDALDWLNRALQWQLAHQAISAQPAAAQAIAATRANIGLALADAGDTPAAITTLEQALTTLRAESPTATITRTASDRLAELQKR